MGGVRAMSPVVSPGAASKHNAQERVALPALGHQRGRPGVRQAW